MEGGVEDGDMFGVGKSGAGGADARQIRGVVERCEGRPLFDSCFHRVGDKRRRGEVGAAVHDTVPDNRDWHAVGS